ncbi:PREDICTED: DNA helicase MCM8-like isoform X2 [Wasmannia auropunctata]|uniref:DNA helicase MCM8-like isoform X2 n=1 Tax=Wasmannia auropunctata TaxID=64793 RepID=UPI0005EF9C4B|nr:PREDICTED: DNA helicase MCM8-like isoform X2 [Wasmannia auropunctata]
MGDKSNFYKKRRKIKHTIEKYELDKSETNYNSDNLDIGRNADIPYYGWRLFFPDKERHKELSMLLTMTNFEAGMSFDIDISELYNDNEFMTQWPNFKHDIYENPTNTLNCIKLGIHQKILKTVPDEKLQYVLNSISSLPTIKLGILNYQPIICLRDLKLNCYGKYLHIYVTVKTCNH